MQEIGLRKKSVKKQLIKIIISHLFQMAFFIFSIFLTFLFKYQMGIVN